MMIKRVLSGLLMVVYVLATSVVRIQAAPAQAPSAMDVVAAVNALRRLNNLESAGDTIYVGQQILV